MISHLIDKALSLIKRVVRRTRQRLTHSLISQGSQRLCPICGWTGHCFLPTGGSVKHRFDAKCPYCGSLERHRLAYLVVQQVVRLNTCDTLHVAPEKCLVPYLKSESETYISIDLYAPAMKQMDLRKMDFADNQFDLVWCSNVLEHIIDDCVAIKEIYRVMRPSGIAFIQVPIWRQQTYENNKITEEEDRLEHFHQEDHVRLYGLDIVERFESVGFRASIVRAADFPPPKVFVHSLSFISTNEVFLFTK